MLHRFADPDTGATGHDPSELRRTLAFLRRRGYELVELREMFRRLREGRHTRDLGIAFTIDDGYADQVRVAGPVFAEFDCPVTIYLTTGFLDRQLWMWWDRIEHVFEACRGRSIMTTLHGTALEYRWDHEDGRRTAILDFTARCKLVPEGERRAAIERLAAAAGVDLPTLPPERYAPMSWADVKRWGERGMSFGPHSLTHPILSRTSDEQSRTELVGSWNRLCEMVQRPTPVFCYPNGLAEDFGPREVATLQSLGLEGAVATTPGYASVTGFHAHSRGPFQVPRLHYPDNSAVVAHFASGLARLRYPAPPTPE